MLQLPKPRPVVLGYSIMDACFSLDTQRRLILIVALLMALASGSLYAFAVMSSDLQQLMYWRSSDVGLVYMLGCVCFMPLVGGLLYDRCVYFMCEWYA
jgi:hypothetical protein